MTITFLGTGTSQGVPVIGSSHPVSFSENPKDKRLRTSVLISFNKINLLIDCSPDFRQQMLYHKITHLEAILFTHHHADHTAGLDDIRPFVYQQGDMPIYAQQSVILELEKRFSYIFEKENRYPGAPSVNVNIINNESFMLHNELITPIEVIHGNLPILGYRIRNLAYITDMKTISEKELTKLQNLHTLVINCLRHKEHPTHLNLEEALEIVNLIKPKQTFFTHISQDMGFYDEVSPTLPKNIFLAYDNLKIEIDDF